MEEQPDVEILIHIGAPSRTVDDARYRSLAAAYLAFEPPDTHPQSGSDDGIEDGRHALATDEDRFSNVPSHDRIGSFQSPQASFQSVIDNANSPQMRVRGAPNHPFVVQQTPVSATQSSWETPPSIVQDSHPMNPAEFASLTSPTRVLENYLQHFQSPSGSSKQDSHSSMLETPNQHSSQYHTHQMIPCTPHVKNVAVLPSNSREGLEYQETNNPHQQPKVPVTDESDDDDDVIEETKFLSSPPGLPRADSEPLLKLRRLDLVKSPRALARAASDVGPRSFPNHKIPVTIELLSTHGFTFKSLEILPPEPPTSELHIEPQDLITEGLRKLGRDVDLSSRFRPKEQTRALRLYERGYWLCDCTSWEPRLKRDAWAFLANYIGTGTAGWGVICKRDTDFRELRVYCWASVVAHIYYVLWLASQRKIVFTGSSWIDAEGAKVIVMGSRDHPYP